jgi:hypothetical protein
MWSVLSVDNGKKGYLSVYTPLLDFVSLSSVPVRTGAMCTSVTNMGATDSLVDYDYLAMVELVGQAITLCKKQLVAVIETPPASFNARSRNASNDNWRAFGIWQAVFAHHGIEPFSLQPSSWKSRMGMQKMSKEYAKTKAAELHPQRDWEKETVDAADAFLIGYALAHKYDDFQFLREADG